jgi:arsenate reductase-like glutaredoxin family protein
MYRETVLGIADDSTDADGVTVFDYRAALKAAREWWQREERRAAGAAEPRSAPYTVNDALDDYLVYYARKGGKSKNVVRKVADAHIRPHLGTISLDRLATKRLRDWHHALAVSARRLRTKSGQKQKLAPVETDSDAIRARRATANRVLTVLKAALNHAYAERYVASADAWNAVKPFREVDAPLVRFLSPGECSGLVNACEPDFRKLVKGALLTEMRYGELARLKIRDIHLDARTLTVALSEEGQELLAETTVGRAHDALVFTHEDGRPWGGITPVATHRGGVRAGQAGSTGYISYSAAHSRFHVGDARRPHGSHRGPARAC